MRFDVFPGIHGTSFDEAVPDLGVGSLKSFRLSLFRSQFATIFVPSAWVSLTLLRLFAQGAARRGAPEQREKQVV